MTLRSCHQSRTWPKPKLSCATPTSNSSCHGSILAVEPRGLRPAAGYPAPASSQDRFSNSGSLAKMAAILCASSRVSSSLRRWRRLQLFFEIHVGKGLPVQIFHDKTGVQFLDGPRLRKVALRHSLLEHARHPFAPRNRQQAATPRGAAAVLGATLS